MLPKQLSLNPPAKPRAGAVVDCLVMLTRVARPAKRLDVVNITPATFDDRNNVIGRQFNIVPAAAKAFVPVMIYQGLPFSGGVSSTGGVLPCATGVSRRSVCSGILVPPPIKHESFLAAVILTPLVTAFVDPFSIGLLPFASVLSLPFRIVPIPFSAGRLCFFGVPCVFLFAISLFPFGVSLAPLAGLFYSFLSIVSVIPAAAFFFTRRTIAALIPFVRSAFPTRLAILCRHNKTLLCCMCNHRSVVINSFCDRLNRSPRPGMFSASPGLFNTPILAQTVYAIKRKRPC